MKRIIYKPLELFMAQIKAFFYCLTLGAIRGEYLLITSVGGKTTQIATCTGSIWDHTITTAKVFWQEKE